MLLLFLYLQGLAGWNSENIVSTDAAIKLEKIGIKAITLHPRTTVQMYKGNADWSLIKELKENVQIPVIGNGDVKTIEDIEKMFSLTKCDGIMIGRAALGNPWFFTQIKKYMKNEDFNEISLNRNNSPVIHLLAFLGETSYLTISSK